jgi:hypothetical protein
VGLDVSNGLFGNFHLNWAGTRWFSVWCADRQLPYPFIGWAGLNDGDRCKLGPGKRHSRLAKQWCEALDEKVPDIAQMGRRLLADPPEDLYRFLYPRQNGNAEEHLSEEEWSRRAVAAWYAILRHGFQNGDTLEYW